MADKQRSDSLAWAALVIVAIFVLGPLVMMAVALPMIGGMMGFGGRTVLWPLWGAGAMVLSLVVVGGVAYAIYRAVGGTSGGSRDPALEELRRAYARGELSEEEYERRRERLAEDRE